MVLGDDNDDNDDNGDDDDDVSDIQQSSLYDQQSDQLDWLITHSASGLSILFQHLLCTP